MRYLCNVESAVATCDSYNFDRPNLRRKKKKTTTTTKHHPSKLRRFTFAELESATNGFSPRGFLGKGSHASVFRATLDGGALTAAVKRITVSVTATAENEIEVLSKIWSRRIVNLIGYAIDSVGGERKKLLLVVEYMPNGSLYDLIHKNPKPPGWSNRVRFALQIAKAVQALHGSNPPVIHRDIKSSNVLVDERGHARLSDFGLALRGHVEDVRVMSTPPAGTLGYLDPCYLSPGDVSAKSDVFSFGILLLEMVSGRRAIDVNYSPPSIVEWALPLIRSGNYQGICDRRIRGPADPTVSRELALLAVRCVRSRAERRPAMVEVLKAVMGKRRVSRHLGMGVGELCRGEVGRYLVFRVQTNACSRLRT
uniref:Receptor protein serine/threonine kinase n=1 Tax=Opuntia streptacantha TaxID=393608 RepID=A0A7C9E904_OPUST